MTSPRRPETHRYGDENDHLSDCWRPYTNRWVCWCGRRLGCPAALDAHQYDHEHKGEFPIKNALEVTGNIAPTSGPDGARSTSGAASDPQPLSRTMVA